MERIFRLGHQFGSFLTLSMDAQHRIGTPNGMLIGYTHSQDPRPFLPIPMKVTIAICTWNRSRLLNQTLASLQSLDVPKGIEWEVVLVDNNSTDDTRAVAEGFQESLPLRYVFEAQQGHAVSRNRAIAESSGDLIIWTDNDVQVSPKWLKNYCDGVRQFPDAAFFGGKINPIFESGRPSWLTATWEKCRCVYAYRDLGNQVFPFPSDQFPYGANFAVVKRVQEQFPFDVHTGRSQNQLLGEDEISVLKRIATAGYQGIWLPDVSVDHLIPADRATSGYVGQYFVGQGQANVLRDKAKYGGRWQAWRVALHNYVCFLIKQRRNPDEWVSHLIRSSIAWGEYKQMSTNKA